MSELEQAPIQVQPPSLSNPRVSQGISVPAPPAEADHGQWMDYYHICLWTGTGMANKHAGDFESVVRMYAKRWDIPLKRVGPADAHTQTHG